MCGIFGYIGQREDTAEIIFKGLKGLEYRGYDSWGIAVINQKAAGNFAKENREILIEKFVGKIGNKKISLPQSNIGIGHTRWATHGGVTKVNAHPHFDCTKKLAVLHNGIVENFQELKDELYKKNHKFLSQTDTEVIIHLIEEYNKTENNLNHSVIKAFNRLRGLNAIVVLDAFTQAIVAAKNGSPLIIGVGENEYFLASDAVGILPYTKNVIFLKDDELVSISQEGLQLFHLPEGKKIDPQIETINWNIAAVDKGSYKYFMIKEIYDQPKIVRNIADTYSDQISDLVDVIKASRGTFFIGAGTAYHAAMAGSYLFSSIAKEHVNTAPASEFNYLEDFLTHESLIITLSQSGETIDVIEPLTRAKKKGATVVGIINALGSTIYRMADYKILLGAGPEKAVASTKAYIAKLAILLMLAFGSAGKLNESRELLLETASEIERLLESENISYYKKIAGILVKSGHIYTIGRGLSFATSLEAALKIKEVSYIHTEGFAGGELKHGPIALIEKNTPCIVFAPKDETFDAIISNAMEIKSRGGIIFGVSSVESPVFDYWINVKDLGPASIITNIIPMQVIAYEMALARKLDPDKPRNLAKSVTVK